MKSFVRKLVCFTMAAALLVSSAACQKQSDQKAGDSKEGISNSNFNATGLPIVKEPVTLTVMAKRTTLSKKAFGEKDIFKKFEQDTNVKIDWIEVAGTNQVWHEKISLAINSGDTPDCLYGEDMKDTDLPLAVDSGNVLALDELIEKYAPNEKKFIKQYPELQKQGVNAVDGKQYVYLGYVPKEEAVVRAPLFINKVWLDKLNLTMPTTIDEYYDVLKAFKQKDPNGNGKADEIPLSTDKDSPITPLFGAWGISGSKTQDKHITINDGKVSFNFTNPKMLDALKYFNKLYLEGLLDPEFMTQESNQFKGKAKASPVILGSIMEYAPSLSTGEKNAAEYEALIPLKGPDGTQKWPVNANAFAASRLFYVFKSCKHPEVAIRWVDYLNDGVNGIILKRGFEGTTWAKDDATKTFWTFEKELSAQGKSYQEIANTEASFNGPVIDIPLITGYKWVDRDPNSMLNQKLKWTAAYKPYLFKEYWPKLGIRKV